MEGAWWVDGFYWSAIAFALCGLVCFVLSLLETFRPRKWTGDRYPTMGQWILIGVIAFIVGFGLLIVGRVMSS